MMNQSIAYRHRRPETEDVRDFYRFLQGMSAAIDGVFDMHRDCQPDEFVARLRAEQLALGYRLHKASVECEFVGRTDRGLQK